jgi:hypothetical protein
MRNDSLIMNSEIVERFEKAMVNHLRYHISIYTKWLVKTIRKDSEYPLFKPTYKLLLLNKYKYESDK